MEGIQTIQALKAVQSSLPAQTTIPSDELVMLYATDGTPIAKISRDDLVKAVASVMASNSQNTFSKLLGVQANGTPMGIGASDLASVLGENIKHWVTVPSSEITDVNDLRANGIYNTTNKQNSPFDYCVIHVVNYGVDECVQIAYDILGSGYSKQRVFVNGSWAGWSTVNYDIPSFYKDYANLSALASALGASPIELNRYEIPTASNFPYRNTIRMFKLYHEGAYDGFWPTSGVDDNSTGVICEYGNNFTSLNIVLFASNGDMLYNYYAAGVGWKHTTGDSWEKLNA